ncbi:14502_t:CDS:1, partial [Cetraspora pellucida]
STGSGRGIGYVSSLIDIYRDFCDFVKCMYWYVLSEVNNFGLLRGFLCLSVLASESVESAISLQLDK